MTQWDGKTRGGKVGYKLFIWILKYTNIRIAYFVLYFVAFWFFIVLDKKPTRFYFREIHKYSKLKTIISIYKNYYTFGQILLDKIAILAGFSKKFTFEFDGEEHLHNLAEEKRGGVLVGSHIGNWEIAGQLLERINTKAHIIMYDGMQQSIKELIDDVVRKKNIGFILISQYNSSYLYEIANALKRKEIIAMHGDRFLPETNTVTTKFMGHETELPAGPFYLASKYGVPVVYVSAIKEKTTHYHFYATKPKYFKYPANVKTRKSELKAMVDDYVQEMEKMVRAYPLQWFNFYQFWKT